VYQRAKMYGKWDHLVLATCDTEIEQLGQKIGLPVVMTGSHHTRALDRVAEAVTLLPEKIADTDFVVCV